MIVRRLGRLAALVPLSTLALGSARAAELPIYPVDANCREATSFFFRGSALAAARRSAFERDCVRRQQDAYAAVEDVWPILQAGDQAACLHIVRTTNYLQLARCVSDRYEQERAAEQTTDRRFRP